MSPEKSPSRTRRASIDEEEARAWVGIYRRARVDAAIAAEALAQFDSDPEAKRVHLALYLCCKESVREHKARQQRHRRFGQFMRWLGHQLTTVPVERLRRGLDRGESLAAACLPEMPTEPAVDQLRRLRRDPAVARQLAVFEQPLRGASQDSSAPTQANEAAA